MAEWKKGRNPLLNALVIDNISKYLSFEELKVCRRLNHLWKKTTNKIFLKRCRPICLEKGLPTPAVPFHKTMLISQFMEIYSDSSHPHPFAHLIRQYRNFLVLFLDEECIPKFYNFMTKVGPQMTSLQLVDFGVLKNSAFPLKNNQIPWLDILSLYPNLNALSLKDMPAEVLEQIVTALVTPRKTNETKLKLTELNLYSGCTSTQTKPNWQRILDLLKTANLPLEKISLDNSSSEMSLKLIQHYSNVLKSLAFVDDFPKPLPLMKALERMSFNRVDLTFLTKVPNLKSLYLNPRIDDSLLASFPKSTPNPLLSLTKLHVGKWKEWYVIDLEQLLLWMPNIQNLEMCLNNKTFSWICKYFPNLKELTVLGDKLDDSGVLEEFDETFEVEGCSVNITNLKALKTFQMAGNHSGYGLTEKSVFYGFSLMPKLSKLTINVKSALSGTTMRALNRGIKIVHVNVV